MPPEERKEEGGERSLPTHDPIPSRSYLRGIRHLAIKRSYRAEGGQKFQARHVYVHFPSDCWTIPGIGPRRANEPKTTGGIIYEKEDLPRALHRIHTKKTTVNNLHSPMTNPPIVPPNGPQVKNQSNHPQNGKKPKTNVQRHSLTSRPHNPWTPLTRTTSNPGGDKDSGKDGGKIL